MDLKGMSSNIVIVSPGVVTIPMPSWLILYYTICGFAAVLCSSLTYCPWTTPYYFHIPIMKDNKPELFFQTIFFIIDYNISLLFKFFFLFFIFLLFYLFLTFFLPSSDRLHDLPKLDSIKNILDFQRRRIF